MQTYELLLILSGKLKGSDVKSALDVVKKVLSKHEAKIVDENIWGLMKLAYSIKRQEDGTYVLWHLNIEPDRVSALDKELLITENVLRFLLIKAPKHGKKIDSPLKVEEKVKKEEAAEKTEVDEKTDKPKDLKAILEEKF